MIVERRPCDVDFDRAEKALRKSAENLRGAAQICVRQAASDLARACGAFKDQDARTLRALLIENLRGGNFENIRDACHLYQISHRSFDAKDLRPIDYVSLSASDLEEAATRLLSDDLGDLLGVGSLSVMSRSASGSILHELRHLL